MFVVCLVELLIHKDIILTIFQSSREFLGAFVAIWVFCAILKQLLYIDDFSNQVNEGNIISHLDRIFSL